MMPVIKGNLIFQKNDLQLHHYEHPYFILISTNSYLLSDLSTITEESKTNKTKQTNDS